MENKSELTEVQHLTMKGLDYPERQNLRQRDADYLLPLSSDEISTIKMALSLLEDRAMSEGDAEKSSQAGTLYSRVKYDGLVKSI